MDHPVLWHFTFSQFAGKVRGALDLKRVLHVRPPLIPGLAAEHAATVSMEAAA
jgi:hypothetical protein